MTVRHPKGWVKTVRRSWLDTALSSNWVLVEPESPPDEPESPPDEPESPPDEPESPPEAKSPKSTEPVKPGKKE